MVYVLVFVVSGLFVYLLKSPRLDEPTRVVLPITTQHLAPQNPDNVRLYPFNPGENQPLALINIEQHHPHMTQERIQHIEQIAKQLAADVGADAVVIKTFGHTQPNSPEHLESITVFRGVAVKLGAQNEG